MMTRNLGGDGSGEELGRGYDDVDIFEPGGLSAIYGALVGVGVGTLGSIAANSFGGTTLAPHRELVGLGAGVVAGGIMAVFPSTRHAGWVAMAAAAVGNGLRAIEHYFGSTTGTGAYGMPSMQSYPRMSAGLGIVQANQMNGMGSPKLMGAPAISPIAGRWGASAMMPTRQ
jgi:hypothetical protein